MNLKFLIILALIGLVLAEQAEARSEFPHSLLLLRYVLSVDFPLLLVKRSAFGHDGSYIKL